MINYSGLQKKDSYNEILNYIQTDQPTVKYPNRKATFLMNTPQYSSLFEFDGLDEQEETLKKARIVEAIGETQLQHHLATTATGGGDGDGWHDPGVMHGPEPAPASQPRSLLNDFRPSQAASSSSASGAGQPTSTLQRPSFIDSDLLARNAANYARANSPAITNPASPPHAMFNLYDDNDYGSVHSEEDGGLGADVTDALDHYQQLEAERLASIAQQAHIHLDSAATQTLPIAHARAAKQQIQLSTIPDIPGHEFKRIRRIADPTYTETPGASSSGPAPPEKNTREIKIKRT